MEIRTKCYYIEYSASKCDGCNDIDCDDCNRVADERFKQYRVKEGTTINNKHIDKINCFATEEEAQKECDRRNNENSIIK